MKNQTLPYNRKLFPYTRDLRKRMTFTERKLWGSLRNKQMCGFKFYRQRPILNYIVDFFCKELMLAIEVDGLTHLDDRPVEKDKNRQKEIEELGINFLRIYSQEILNDYENVLRNIEGWILNKLEEKEGEHFKKR